MNRARFADTTNALMSSSSRFIELRQQTPDKLNYAPPMCGLIPKHFGWPVDARESCHVRRPVRHRRVIRTTDSCAQASDLSPDPVRVGVQHERALAHANGSRGLALGDCRGRSMGCVHGPMQARNSLGQLSSGSITTRPPSRRTTTSVRSSGNRQSPERRTA